MALSGLSLLTIAERGWEDRREVRAANISASWAVSSTGRLSAMLSAREAWLLGISDYLGRWVKWDHPTLGTWSGVIEDTHINMGAGTVELACASMTSLMKKRRTRKRQRTSSSPAGSLVYRIFSDLAVNDIPYDLILCDTDGDPVTIRWNADDVYNVVSGLARTSNHQFDATTDDEWLTTFQFRAHVGSDKTADVVLYEGYQIADGTITPSLANVVNDILAVSAEGNWDDAQSIAVVDGPSMQTYGRRQDTRRYYGFTTGQALATRARVDLQSTAGLTVPLSLKMSDRAPELNEIRQGDTIRVRSSSANAHYLMMVTGRSVDAESGYVTVVGLAEAEE